MIGSFSATWGYLYADVWATLARSRKSPSDLFVDLYREATDYLQTPINYNDFELAMNDREYARRMFEKLQARDFDGEFAIVEFLEAAHETVENFGVPRFGQLFKYLMERFALKYNLRYAIDSPFKIRLIIPGVFSSFYQQLVQANAKDAHLKSLLHNFERTFGSYARTKHVHELSACVSNAFIYAEGLASKAIGKSDTLAKLCDVIPLWPHSSVKKTLQTLYGFRNDYPGLGHAGNPAGKLRDLEARDAIVVCLLLLSFSGYLTTDVRIEESFTG